ncbi:putative transketolase C-terminal section [Nymphon striatum]|nr:putative transketolase C-terminal section [Nymphon striatum]
MTKYIDQGKNDTRSGYGAGMTELGRTNPNVVALCADLVGSLKIQTFIDENPERFFQIGIAEANMMGIAAGLTIGGKIPFTGTFANFSTGRVYDQIRQSIAYSGKNVKICASHAGITLGEDGATHQILEDIGLMKMLPGMAATLAIADYEGPVYLRFGRPKVANFTPVDQKFEIGKALMLSEGTDVTIVATGHLVWESLIAAEALEAQGISAEHNYLGGLGESIAGMLATQHPTPQEFIATQDTFGESGTPAQLMEKYGLNNKAIEKAVLKVLTRK